MTHLSINSQTTLIKLTLQVISEFNTQSYIPTIDVVDKA